MQILQDFQTTIAALICCGGLGVFLLWAAFAPLAEGVTVAGRITIEDNRKVVQHLEGGIIKKLRVSEGAVVEKGDIIVELDDVRARAQRDQALQNLVSNVATLDRLNGLLHGADVITFSKLDDYDIRRETLLEIKARQEQFFAQQKELLHAEIAVLEVQKTALEDSIEAKAAQIEIVKASAAIAKDEIDLKRSMLEDKLIRIDAVQRLEREYAKLQEGALRLSAERQEAKARALELSEQIKQARIRFEERISEELVETKTTILSLQEQYHAAQDVLKRTTIFAPQSGVVMNMHFFTVGGVIGPGEPILEVVPQNVGVIAQVQLNPADRDAVHEGLSVKARLSSYKAWLSPQLEGVVIGISADLKTSPDTGASYYEARIMLDLEEIKQNDQIDIMPGMPVETFIDSGVRRTFLNYLFEPIAGVMRRAL